MEHRFVIKHFGNLSIVESFNILEIIVLNRKIDGSGITHLCFTLFDRLLLNKLNENSKDILYNQLKILMKYIKKLILENRFLSNLFLDLLNHKCMNHIPFDILWWLDENNIYYLEHHCATTNPDVILNQLISLFNNNSDISEDEPYNPLNIACDFLLKMISFNYTTKCLSISINSNWSNTCSNIFEDFVNKCVESFLENHNNLLIKFIKSIQKRQGLNKTILKYFYRNILNKFILLDGETDVYDAYVMQALWTTKVLHKNTTLLFYEIVKRFDLIELDNFFVGKSNWKYALIIISIYISKKNNSQQLKGSKLEFTAFRNDLIDIVLGFVQNCIQKGLNDQNVSLLQKAFLFQRQFFIETEQIGKSYSEWYADTFGMNSNLKTTSDKHIFSFFLQFMHKFINYEPEYALKTHIERSLRVPPNCQSEMLDFKDLCRVQLTRIQQSPVIEITRIKFPVICILELIIQCENLAWVLQQKEIIPLILPYFIEDKKFDQIKEAMISKSFLSNTQILNCIPLEYEIKEMPHFNNDSDSEDMFE